MTETIYYLTDSILPDTSGIPAVICTTAEIAESVKNECHKTDTAVLVVNDVDAYKKLGLDGIYFTSDFNIKEFKQIRKENPDAQLGIDCLDSRHTAMVFGEAYADFVAFSGEKSSVEEVVNWWGLLMEVPVVAICNEPAPKGADFIILAS